MSTEWDKDTDFYNVLAAAVHLDDVWTGESPSDRQKADALFLKRIASLGLTPIDRRRLEWTIATAGEATDRRTRRAAEPAEKPPTKRAAKQADPRAALALVK
jgi:hypothetical protein